MTGTTLRPCQNEGVLYTCSCSQVSVPAVAAHPPGGRCIQPSCSAPSAAIFAGTGLLTAACCLRSSSSSGATAAAAGAVSAVACALALWCFDSGTSAAPVLSKSDLLAARDAALRSEPDELLREQISRNLHFLGEEAQASVGRALVVIVGVGSVGSHAAALLGRSGVGCLRLVDPARLTVASCARHATATPARVPNSRAGATRDALRSTVPALSIQVCETALGAANAATLLAGADMVLLCTRDTPTLAVGLAHSHAAGLRALACLSGPASRGQSAGAHPSLVYLHELLFSPDARSLIRHLRRALPQPMPLPDQLVLAPVPPTLSCWPSDPHSSPSRRGDPPPQRAIPASAAIGHAAASAALCALGGLVLQPRRNVFPRTTRDAMWRAVARRERDIFGANVTERTFSQIWPEDVEYLVDEVRASGREARVARVYSSLSRPRRSIFSRRRSHARPWSVPDSPVPSAAHPQVYGRRCAKTGESLGGRSTLVLTRWRADTPIALDNAILLTKAEAEQHDARGSLHGQPPAVIAAVDRALGRAGGPLCSEG